MKSPFKLETLEFLESARAQRKQRLLHVASALTQCCDAVDRGVKEVETDMYSVLKVAAQNLERNVFQLVVEYNDMVAVPAHRAGYMQQNLIAEKQGRRDFV